MVLAAERLEMRTPGMILGAALGMGTRLDKGKARPRGHRDDGEQERNEAANHKAWHPALKIARDHAGCRIGPSTGMMNQNALPSPGIDSAPIVPPCSSTNCLQSASPSPVPCACRLGELSTWVNA